MPWKRKLYRGLFALVGMALLVSAGLFVRWHQPLRIDTAALLMRGPKMPPPPLVSITFRVTMPTLWHVEHCFLPDEAYALGFRETAAEYRSYERNPVVSFVINQRGTVDEVSLRRSSGSAVLDQRIITWLHQLHFPVQKGCELAWRGNGVVNVEF